MHMIHVDELSMINGIPSVPKDTGVFPARGRWVVANAMRDLTVSAPSVINALRLEQKIYAVPQTKGTE